MATTKPKVTIRSAKTITPRTATQTKPKVNGVTVSPQTGANANAIEAAIRAAQGNAGQQATTVSTPVPAQTETAEPAAEVAAPDPSSTPISIKDTPASALEKLFAQYNSATPYRERTDAERQERAAGQYQSYYDQLRLAARQQADRSDLALAQQRDNLARNYNDQREASAQQYANAYSQADRQMLSRGMQRSTYAAQTLANLATQGAEAQQQLWTRQGEDQAQVDAQRAQLAQQLAQQLGQFDVSQASDIMNRVRELEDQDYERGLQEREYRDKASAQLYSYLLDATKNGYLNTGVGATNYSGISGSIASSIARQMQAAGYTGGQQSQQSKAVTDSSVLSGLNMPLPAQTKASTPTKNLAAILNAANNVAAMGHNNTVYNTFLKR